MAARSGARSDARARARRPLPPERLTPRPAGGGGRATPRNGVRLGIAQPACVRLGIAQSACVRLGIARPACVRFG